MLGREAEVHRLACARPPRRIRLASVALIDELAVHTAAFHFLERDGAAFLGNRALAAVIAKWLPPGSGDDELPDVLPLWFGSHLPWQRARQRFGFIDVFTVAVGVRDARIRSALVAHVQAHPPLGMFDVDEEADDHGLPLIHGGFILPNAVIRLSERGRRYDREFDIDVIGPVDDEEAEGLDWVLDPSPENGEDALGDALLRLLARRVGRRITTVSASDGFDAVVDHAYELWGLGAASAAGTVAAVAFESLMRAALADAESAAGGHMSGPKTQLAKVIDRLATLRALEPSRLHAYRELRNDLAHRLGDANAAARPADEIYEGVARLLGWLDRQQLQPGRELADVAPEPALTHEQLWHAARAAGDVAAQGARTTPMQIDSSVFEPYGFAWVTVRDLQRPFTKWLISTGVARKKDDGAQVMAPGLALERNLAWAHACASRLRKSGVTADYVGVPD